MKQPMFTHEARMVRLLALVGSVTVFFDANLTLGVRSVSGWRVRMLFPSKTTSLGIAIFCLYCGLEEPRWIPIVVQT